MNPALEGEIAINAILRYAQTLVRKSIIDHRNKGLVKRKHNDSLNVLAIERAVRHAMAQLITSKIISGYYIDTVDNVTASMGFDRQHNLFETRRQHTGEDLFDPFAAVYKPGDMTDDCYLVIAADEREYTVLKSDYDDGIKTFKVRFMIVVSTPSGERKIECNVFQDI